MSSSKDILNDVLTDLGPLGSFGVMFLASSGEILHGSFTNEEHESLAVDIVKRSFSNMDVSDFIQRGLTDLNSQLYVFKIAEDVVVSLITNESIGTVLVNLNTIVKKYHTQLEIAFPIKTPRKDSERSIDFNLHEIQDEVLCKIVRSIFEKIKQLGTIEILFFEGDKFCFGNFADVDKEYEKLAIDLVQQHISGFNVSDFIRKTLGSDIKLYVYKLSETLTTAFLAKSDRPALGQILFRLKEIIEELSHN
ncbi:MAG: hypothetical protein ACW963_09960 [Candidatus Sifarchaeia archaeon]|jgi:hypothetical protein